MPFALGALVTAACASDAGEGPASERVGTASSAQVCTMGTLLQGVDTSSGQGQVDWNAAKSAGIAWVIMKATQGNYDADAAFPKNWAPAKAAGVVRGAYHFFDPTLDGVVQANYFLKAMGPLDAEDLAPVLDVECPTGASNCLGFANGSGAVPAAAFRTHLLDWLTTVEAATGRKPVIYTYESFFTGSGAAGTGTNVDTTGLDAYPLWIAAYTGTACFNVPAPWTAAALWQYGDNGAFGALKPVDVDRMVGPIDELLGWPAPKHASRADLNGDGHADVCGRDPSGVTCALGDPKGGFGTPFAGPGWSDGTGWRPPAYASTIQLADVTGDGLADVCARGAAGITCAPSTGTGFGAPFAGPAWSDAAGWAVPAYYATVQFADIDGDGKADVCARGPAGILCAIATGTGFGAPFAGPAWSDAAGWNQPSQYLTIRFPDIDGDGRADVCGRASGGIHCAKSAGTSFGADIIGPAWDDAGWKPAAYASTIQFPDVDGDGKADVCGRGVSGIICALSTGTGFSAPFVGPAWSDAAGWNSPSSYATITFLDLNGDGKDDVCGRTSTGITCAVAGASSFGTPFAGPAWSDASGWGEPRHYGTIGTGDINGDGLDDLCARGAAGMTCAPSTGSAFGPAVTGPGWTDAVWGVAPYWGTTRIVGGVKHAVAAGDGGVVPVADGGVTPPADGGISFEVDGSVSASVSASAGCHCRASGRGDGAGGVGGTTGGVAVVAAGMALAIIRRRKRPRACA